MDKQEANDDATKKSGEKGKRDAASIANIHAREIPPLKSQQLDKGDNVLNPMADKREGIKREKTGS